MVRLGLTLRCDALVHQHVVLPCSGVHFVAERMAMTTSEG